MNPATSTSAKAGLYRAVYVLTRDLPVAGAAADSTVAREAGPSIQDAPLPAKEPAMKTARIAAVLRGLMHFALFAAATMMLATIGPG